MRVKTDKATWDAIKTEYLADTLSYRALGKKYGVDYTAICRKAKKENWDAVKLNIQRDAEERVHSFIVDTKVSNSERAMRMTETLLSKIEDAINSATRKDVSSLKGLVTSLKDLNEMGVFNVVNDSADIKVEMQGLDDYAD